MSARTVVLTGQEIANAITEYATKPYATGTYDCQVALECDTRSTAGINRYRATVRITPREAGAK